MIPLPGRLTAGPSRVVYFRDGSPAYVTLSQDEKWRIPVVLGEVDSRYVGALIEIEDKRFWWHPGFDPFAIVRAAAQNFSAGDVVSGASTLTMQLARMLESRPRTLGSKLIEVLRAVQLELCFSKQEILQAYLTFVPYGRNIEGIEAASIAYFGHRADALSATEIATLLAVPQDPNARYPTPRHEKVLCSARNAILSRIEESGAWAWPSTPAARLALQAVPEGLRPFPREAPHAAQWLLGQDPFASRIYTTLDPVIQRFATGVFQRARPTLASRGIFNGSGVIANHATGAVAALVGNFGFLEDKHGAQIIGFDVPRSPGSLLKPFFYAAAIDRGVALPETLVTDIPVRYGSYEPENYDEDFHGLVRLEEALSWSLNVPFVNLLRQLGVEPMLGLFQTLGVQSLRTEPGYYGLSAAIGGVEITPLEIAGLYATLAHEGYYHPLLVLRDPAENTSDGSEHRGFSAFSEGAAYLTRKTLSLRDRSDFPGKREFSATPPSIHWKTGTSFGHRDAWAAGSGPAYTAVVWLGNFDNAPSNELVGADAAGPILFDLLEGLVSAEDFNYRDLAPPDLEMIEVCAYSGQIPTEACLHTTHALARTVSVPTRPCQFHVRREIDLDTGLALGPLCLDGCRHAPEIFLRWPTGVRRWLKDQYRTLPEPPSFAAECRKPSSEGRPAIVSPPPGHVIFLLRGRPVTEQEIPLEAEGAAGVQLSWFVDGKFLGHALPDERLWWAPTPGKHLILAQNEMGESDSQWVEVREDLSITRK
ncbi:MAG: penicillin-binding protein 1C [Bdellovibrionota bacterium]